MSKLNNIVSIKEKIPFEKDGKKYLRIIKSVKVPRITYLKGNISGKYRGDLLSISDSFHRADFYDFEIYEAIVSEAESRKNIPFENPKGVEFPKDKLPQNLNVHILHLNQSFGINILEPALFNFESNPKLIQVEDKEAFGTFSGKITGYIYDYEEHIDDSEIIEIKDKELESAERKVSCESSGIATGKIEKQGNYTRKEFFCKHHDDNLWAGWENTAGTGGSDKEGCGSLILNLLGILFIIFIALSFLPILPYIFTGLIILLLIHFIQPILKWVVRIFGILFVLALLISIFELFTNSNTYIPRPRVEDHADEKLDKDFVIPKDTIILDTFSKDSIITRKRIWKDYDGIQYTGIYSMNLNSVFRSSVYKSSFQIPQNISNPYSFMVYSIKEYDKNQLSGLYKMFDSIQKGNSLNKIKFAEVIVSFVQDIPYYLILDSECDANLYNDNFIKEYLSSKEARCYGYQKYGINSPLEFIASLKGDCDTRTLLLYTVLDHYGYDVALMSSEEYGHSILGINLPYDGISYEYNNSRYVLWETTSPNLKPGIISEKLTNLNYWKISLKSKNYGQ
jgi:hypothetical protein